MEVLMNTLRNNQKSVLSVLGYGIGLLLLGAYLRGWWNTSQVGQEIQISTVAFMILAVLIYSEVRALYEEFQTRPRK